MKTEWIDYKDALVDSMSKLANHYVKANKELDKVQSLMFDINADKALERTAEIIKMRQRLTGIMRDIISEYGFEKEDFDLKEWSNQ